MIYPFNRSTRAEFLLSVFHQGEDSDLFYYGMNFPMASFSTAWPCRWTVSLTSETTRFANYGPNMGHTFRLSVRKYFKLFSDSLDAYTLEGDFRQYLRIDNQTLLAFRLSGFYSGGKNRFVVLERRQQFVARGRIFAA